LKSSGEDLLAFIEETGRRLTFTPDGKTLASIQGGRLQLTDRTTRERREEPLQDQTGSGSVDAIVFSPNGKMLALAGQVGP
jgi:WD40 repeat protein